ncbi:MAG TPA: histidine phosphatase family protein [Balneolaceae bacterium]|nr:histidine phosphatase family protein [Balneolaceae bacterium]
MKTILIMRHAKSSWSSPYLKDFDRPLNSRGKNDAPKMGLFLKQKQVIPQKIYCSPAKRTRATLKKVLKEINADEGIAEFVDDLYFSGYDAYIEAIRSTSPEKDIVMTLGHNPMTEESISILSSTPVRQPVKTATIACLTCSIANWSDIKPGSCELKWITGPKDLL